jgi:hypothetical protein
MLQRNKGQTAMIETIYATIFYAAMVWGLIALFSQFHAS